MSTGVKKVLLADDEPLARLVARKCLEAGGCFVTEAESIAQAEALWTANAFDLVVLDHRLEDGLGVDLLRRMRAAGRCEPVIYLTAETEEISAATRCELGLAAVLSKPLNMEALSRAAATAKAADREPGAAAPERRGHFLVIRLPVALSPEMVAELQAAHAGLAWPALDLAGTPRVDAAAWPVLAGWADACRARGGRLAVVRAAPAVAAAARELGMDRQLDLAPDLDALDALSRRLSAPCERLALLDTVVRRDA